MPPKLAPIETVKFEAFLRAVGCKEEEREHEQKRKGGHKKYKRDGLLRPIIIQAKPEVPVMVIKSNLRTLGISTKEYLAKIDTL